MAKTKFYDDSTPPLCGANENRKRRGGGRGEDVKGKDTKMSDSREETPYVVVVETRCNTGKAFVALSPPFASLVLYKATRNSR